jgi:hypothetical protein
MQIAFKKFFWTQHSQIKMRQYGLSKQKLLGILHRPERREKGIVPGTTAVMKTNKVFKKTLPLLKGKTQPALAKTSAWQRKAPGEIWIMYKDVKNSPNEIGQVKKIISAWRYPGISKPGEEIPIPQDIKNEILNSNQDLNLWK